MTRRRVALNTDTTTDSSRPPHRRDQRKHSYKLNAGEWLEIQQRLLAGDKVADIADDYNVSPQVIYDRCVTGRQNQVRADQTRKLAATIAKSEVQFAGLPVVQQVMVRSLADHLKNISGHLAGAATYGAQTAHKLSAIAHAQVEAITPDSNHLDNAINLHSALTLTAGANEAAKIGIDLLKANKEALKDDPGGNVIDMTAHLIKDSDPVAASATYQRLVGQRR